MLMLKIFFQCLVLKVVITSAVEATSAASIVTQPGNISLASSKGYVSRLHDDVPSPTQPGIISTCSAYYLVEKGDYCDTVVSKFGHLTLSDFYSWNPAVKSDCSHLLAGYYVCIAVSNTPAASSNIATAAHSPASTAPAPTPTQTGIANNCNNYYEVVSGDVCIGIANSYKITLAQFYSWNPSVGTNCQNLLAGYFVCVGVAEPTTGTTVPASTTTCTAPTSAAPAPSPTQSGIASDCTEYYEAKSGNTCISIVGLYSSYLTLALFEQWNPAVGNDCYNLLARYYYCVATTSVHG